MHKRLGFSVTLKSISEEKKKLIGGASMSRQVCIINYRPCSGDDFFPFGALWVKVIKRLV